MPFTFEHRIRRRVREVESGMESSRKSGEALQEILLVIHDLTQQIHQIATAAEEQTPSHRRDLVEHPRD